MSSIAPRALAALTLAAAVPAMAASYDLVADWNPGANPNGSWSFLSGSSLLPYWDAMPPLGGVGGYAPSPDSGYFLPVFFQSGASGSDIMVHSYDGFNGHAASGEAVLRWTSPISGTLDLGGYFYYGQPTLARSNEVVVALAGSTLLSTTVSYAQHQDYANRYSFALSGLTVTAGDTLDISFVRSPGYAPGTVTAMELTVSTHPVPEPASYALLLGGLGLLGWLRGRRSAA